MPTFEELYEQVAKSALAGESEQQIRAKTLHFDRRALACLLHPEKYAPVWRTGDCDCTSDKAGCAAKCPFDAMQIDDDGNVAVNPDRCVGCSDCVERCEGGHFTVSRDTVRCCARCGMVTRRFMPLLHRPLSASLPRISRRSAARRL